MLILSLVRGAPILLLFALSASAQILNSERIEQTFGSYGIEVLYSDGNYRLSNLYSVDDGERITRTLAIVAYPEAVDSSFAEQHRAILGGSSIGATLASAGWNVTKGSTVYFGLPSAELGGAIPVAADTALAAHAYLLTIARDGKQFDYAWIVEIHHPAYLSQDDLVAIYGLEDDSRRLDSVTKLTTTGLALLAQHSAFGQ